MRPRVLPVLTLAGKQMVKTIRFADPKYLGDPFNALRLFNAKEVDEMIVLDITASREGRSPDMAFVADLSGECFMPLAFGGGISSVDQVEKLLAAGVEKVILNSALFERGQLLRDASREFGSQAIVASVDVQKRRVGGHRVVRRKRDRLVAEGAPARWVVELQNEGAGEVLLTSTDRDGTAQGYDLGLVASCREHLTVPLVACGGAGSIRDLGSVLTAGADGAAAGRLFTTHGRHMASLVSYPDPDVIEDLATDPGSGPKAGSARRSIENGVM